MFIIKYNRGNGIEEFLKRYRSKDYAQEICDAENEFTPKVKHWVEEYKSTENVLNEAIKYLENEQKIISWTKEEIERYEDGYHKRGFDDAIIVLKKFLELKNKGE